MADDPTGLRRYVFCDCDVDDWPPPGTDDKGEPWSSFVRARTSLRAGKKGEAEDLWRMIASNPDLESRQTLQAWHFLRSVGAAPPEEIAKQVLGAVAEVAVTEGHDLLAGYADGSARYLNHSGAAVVIDDRIPAVENAIGKVFKVGEAIAKMIGPWEGPLPLLPPGHTRLTMLTPSGPHFGQGPDEALQRRALRLGVPLRGDHVRFLAAHPRRASRHFRQSRPSRHGRHRHADGAANIWPARAGAGFATGSTAIRSSCSASARPICSCCSTGCRSA